MSDLVLFQPVRALDRNGVFAPGALARFYEPGTTTPRTVYTDSALSTAHPTPLVADASGVFAAVYTNGPVKVTITDADGTALPKSPMDPAFVVPATGAAASGVSFDPTGAIPVDNVQEAIETVQANWLAGLAGAGIANTGNAPLMANLDATNAASGIWRFDATTTGTRPADWASDDVGTIVLWRETATAAVMLGISRDDGYLWKRGLVSGAWGSWARMDARTQDQATWNAAASTVESEITPAKLAAAIDNRKRVYQVEDRKTSGTAGGGSTAATWVTRDLNTEAVDGIDGAALATNVVTLPAGRYHVTGWSVSYRSGGHRVRVYSVTGSAELLRGTSAYSATSADTSPTLSLLNGEVTLAVETEVRLDHWVATTRATDGLGLAVTDGGSEVYSMLRFEWLGAS